MENVALVLYALAGVAAMSAVASRWGWRPALAMLVLLWAGLVGLAVGTDADLGPAAVTLVLVAMVAVWLVLHQVHAGRQVPSRRREPDGNGRST
jgi:hypothetical protein